MSDLIKGGLVYLILLGLIMGGFKYFQSKNSIVIEAGNTNMNPDYPPGSYSLSTYMGNKGTLGLGRAVAYHAPTTPPKIVVGWVMAHAGQKVAIKKGEVFVDDAPARRQPAEINEELVELVVPRGCAFILTNVGGGDSISYGPIPVRDILGALK